MDDMILNDILDDIYLYRVMGRFNGLPVEEIDLAENKEEAFTLLREYSSAYGACFTLWVEDLDGNIVTE